MRRKSILVLVTAILCFALYNSRECLILILHLLLGGLAIAFSGWLLGLVRNLTNRLSTPRRNSPRPSEFA
jgi:hypothetical protein